MKKKGLVALALAATMSVSSLGLASCGSKKGDNELWITYFKGGYGSEWVEQLARKFESENAGVKVKTSGDTQLINAVPNMMKNGTNYDLIFCHDIAWEDFVNPGTIYCLDDLYATEVSEGVTFADRIWDEDVLASASYPDRDGNIHYYKVPWTIGTAGIAYNITVMDRLDDWLGRPAGQKYLATEAGGGNTDRRWNGKAPVDYYELMQYCNDIYEAKIPSDPTEPTSDTIAPFTWSGYAEEWQWDYVLFDWWGQLAGPETMNTFKNFGNVDENFKLDMANRTNPDKEVYNPDKFAVTKNSDGTVDKDNSTYVGWGEYKQAYQLWYNLVADPAHKNWSYSKVASLSKFENEQAFASGKAAMTPAACWIENESKEYLDHYKQKVSLMPTPVISNVKLDANGNVLPKNAENAATTIDAIRAAEGVTDKVVTVGGINYNRVSFTSSFGDSVMIPNKATSKDLAVKFLLFMQEEENAQMFTRLSGGTVLPYKYKYWESFVENGEDKATAWQKSIFDIDRNSTKFNNYTQHPMMRSTGLKGSASMTTIWPKNNYYYLKAWQGASPTGAEAGLASYQPKDLIPYLYSEVVSKNWNSYKSDL